MIPKQSKFSQGYDNERNSTSFSIESAEVFDIILDETHPDYKTIDDIGTIKFKRLNSDLSKSDNNLSTARPFFPHIKLYPLLHELILIIPATGATASEISGSTRFYYLSSINVWNLLNLNALPNSSTYLPQETQNDKSNNYSTFTGNTNNQSSNKKIEFGQTFIENPNVMPIRPFEGDIIYYGRWGQTVRFGSTVKNKDNKWSEQGNNGDPIIIITNSKPKSTVSIKKLRIEDINEDSSSIYICDGQLIPIKYKSKNFKSFGINQSGNTLIIEKPKLPNEFSGKQIIIDSDRLILHSKNENILLNSGKSIGLSSINTINMDADKGIIFESPKIYIGARGKEPLVRGNKLLLDILNPLLSELSKLTVITPLGKMSISPEHIAIFTQIIVKLQTIISQKVFID